LSDLVEVVV
jgi:hypothetical protein